MRFRALKAFDWDGRHYERGDILEEREDHPRIPMMVRMRFFVYDATLPSDKSGPTEPRGEPVTAKSAKGRR